MNNTATQINETQPKTIKSLKQELKVLSVEIRKLKSQRKSHQSGNIPGLNNKRYDARYLHIIYCLLRGRKFIEIEQKWKNEPNIYMIKAILKQYIIIEDCLEIKAEIDWLEKTLKDLATAREANRE